MITPTQEQVVEIMRAGILAPSADNHHHILFEPYGDGLRIWAGPAFTGSISPHRRVLNLISLGAVTENILLKTREIGIEPETRWSPDSAHPDLLLDLRWGDAAAVGDNLVQAIPLRHTNRRFYQPSRLKSFQLDALKNEAEKIAGAELLWLDPPSLRRKILHLIFLAESERFRCQPLHQELFSSVRFDVGWDQTAPESIPPGALEVEPVMRGAFAALRNWKLMRVLNLFGAHLFLGLRAGYLPCRLSPHIGLISTSLGREDGAIAAGRAFERLWLHASLSGLAIQPMAASAVLPLQEMAADQTATKVKNALNEGWAEIAPGRIPLILFRLGHAAPPTLTAGRRPIDTYLKP